MTQFEKGKSSSSHEEQPIAVVDSGVGGLTVLHAIRKLLPSENLIYFGDTAHVPYGNKSPSVVTRYMVENIKFLLKLRVKAVVIACNTASAHAEEILKKTFSIPIIGVVKPGVHAAVSITKSGRIAVCGTKGMIQSNLYQQLITKELPNGSVFPIACPLFVPFVEEGLSEHKLVEPIIEYYLEQIKEKEVDTTLLGCTHYPFLQSKIKNFLGDEITVIDSATVCAEHLKNFPGMILKEKGEGSCRYFVSDDPENFAAIARNFIQNKAIPRPTIESSAVFAVSGVLDSSTMTPFSI